MSELSLGARSVFDAYISHWTADPYEISPEALAAALRAAADQLKYKLLDVEVVDCSQLRLLADELEAQ
ncbi:hypothetical protein EBT31_19690 [bacterium]|jgi:hypothetical protein|nr:hypothetical protein [bacterium]